MRPRRPELAPQHVKIQPMLAAYLASRLGLHFLDQSSLQLRRDLSGLHLSVSFSRVYQCDPSELPASKFASSGETN